MNKKEVLEIKKQFTAKNIVIEKICGCFVDSEKQIRLIKKDSFLSLPEEEAFKYLDIFRKTLSGSMGKHLLEMEFPYEEEQAGGRQEFLMKLRNNKLEDDTLIKKFYDHIVEHFRYNENYYIILISGAYDIPGKANDGIIMEDASDEVYNFLLCSLCPIGLSKPGLSYNTEKNNIEDRIRDWVVEMPVSGFLFPAFTDRSTDVHHALCYARKSKEIYPELIEALMGTQTPMTADTQTVSFQKLIQETLGKDCNYETVKEIQQNILELIEEHKEDPEILELTKEDLAKVLEKSGVPEYSMEVFSQTYDTYMDRKVIAANLVDEKKMEIILVGTTIRVKPDMVHQIKQKVIDGRNYFLIPMDNGTEVNGVEIHS